MRYARRPSHCEQFHAQIMQCPTATFSICILTHDIHCIVPMNRKTIKCCAFDAIPLLFATQYTLTTFTKGRKQNQTASTFKVAITTTTMANKENVVSRLHKNDSLINSMTRPPFFVYFVYFFVVALVCETLQCWVLMAVTNGQIAQRTGKNVPSNDRHIYLVG